MIRNWRNSLSVVSGPVLVIVGTVWAFAGPPPAGPPPISIISQSQGQLELAVGTNPANIPIRKADLGRF
jgi:hypothetical protein